MKVAYVLGALALLAACGAQESSPADERAAAAPVEAAAPRVSTIACDSASFEDGLASVLNLEGDADAPEGLLLSATPESTVCSGEGYQFACQVTGAAVVAITAVGDQVWRVPEGRTATVTNGACFLNEL